MPNKQYTSPFASSFKSAIKRGTPCSAVITSIAKSNNKAPKAVFESLFKAGLCNRQKFNGQWIYWSSQSSKKSPSFNRNQSQWDMWQSFIDWFICSGHCTPAQLTKHAGSQKEFMNFCRKFFAAQFSSSNSSSNSSSKSSSKKSPRKSNKSSKKSPSTRARKTSTSSKKRATSTKAKKRITTRSKKTTSSPKARKYSSTTRKSSSTRSFKFPTSTRRTIRRAA